GKRKTIVLGLKCESGGANEKRKRGGNEIVEELKKEPVEGGVKGKRKHGCGEIAKGWTKEQELALRKAYFTTKPTPHFWKNVAKMASHNPCAIWASSCFSWPKAKSSCHLGLGISVDILTLVPLKQKSSRQKQLRKIGPRSNTMFLGIPLSLHTIFANKSEWPRFKPSSCIERSCQQSQHPGEVMPKSQSISNYKYIGLICHLKTVQQRGHSGRVAHSVSCRRPGSEDGADMGFIIFLAKHVPGKSKQDCFDRVHDDFHTPPQCQPRSRAKAINSSPLRKFSISASKLLKPTEKKSRKSNILKPKNIINQKSIENLLQRHLKVDQDHKGDIFSILEPNIDFSISTNAIQPSQKLCTPKQQKENQGLLLSCTERSPSSSSHKKYPSRFSVAPGVQDLGSPPVLKQVKNKVQHEKYVNQLRVRDLRRRAASCRAKMSAVGDGNDIQKKDVKAAKVALVSEARDAINRFQQSQVNLMDNTCSSDGDYDGDIGVECESE
ncbi:hypothetical protein L195_g025711, partial [Trifolium pratense]